MTTVSGPAVHPQDLGLRAQATAIQEGTLDPDDLLDATLARIASRDGPIGSTPVVFAAEARAMLAEAPLGPLRGVPVTVKDMIALPWRAAGNGTRFELIPAQASGPYRRLRDAGAVVVGVANQHVLGLGSTGTASAYGPQANPWALDRCAGGSSGGSAAAVAARLVAGSVGSDSGGSTRLPASYCGVVGLKLTYRSVPYDGYFGRGTTFSAPGALARDGGDCRLLAEALLARSLPIGHGAALRIGLVVDPYWVDLVPEVEQACRAGIDAAGWATTDIELPHMELAGPAATARLLAELSARLPTELLRSLDPVARAVVLLPHLLAAGVVPRADRVRAAVRRGLAEVFGTVDVLAWPTTPATAPPLADPTVVRPSGPVPADLANVGQASLANLCGNPGISVPVGWDADGLPIGLQLLAPWGEEARLLDAAEHVERATDRRFVALSPVPS